MDNELLKLLGAEVAEALATLRAEVRREWAAALEAAQREADEAVAVLRARLVETEHRAELAERALQALREVAGDPVVAFSRDAGGGVSLIQRHGPPRAVPLPDIAALVQAAVDAMREEVKAEAQAAVARSFELFCNAPAWSEATVYTEGQLVQTDIGRTYRVRQGVKATTGRFPGDHAEHWERVGTGGFRVLKSRPEALAPGDVFTEHDARFLHDGRATILFVPKAPKTSDIERAVRAPMALAEAAQQAARQATARDEALQEAVARSLKAANDAGDLSVQALAAVEALRRSHEARHANPGDGDEDEDEASGGAR